MTKLNYWNETWSLDEAQCPCDVHLVEYLEGKKAKDAVIFHFGTGNHHIVGLKLAENGSNCAVLGITASPQEYDDYVELLIQNPRLGHTYKAYFGDIYQLDARLLPRFDYVEPVPRRRVPHARERQLRRADRPRDDADAGRQAQSRRRDPLLYGLVRLRQGRGRGPGAGASSGPSSRRTPTRRCSIFRKRAG